MVAGASGHDATVTPSPSRRASGLPRTSRVERAPQRSEERSSHVADRCTGRGTRHGEPVSARLEAFSDGVFAVAITLLALDLAVDGPGHGSLAHQLADHWPSFVAYVVSFFVIGITWVNHHALVDSFRKVDRSLMFLNLVLLMFVVAIPFATSTMSTYLRNGGNDAHVAAALYGSLCARVCLSCGAIFVLSSG